MGRLVYGEGSASPPPPRYTGSLFPHLHVACSFLQEGGGPRELAFRRRLGVTPVLGVPWRRALFESSNTSPQGVWQTVAEWPIAWVRARKLKNLGSNPSPILWIRLLIPV